jgi:predicted O-linked N-acetylglucosamine transferase (SPINDLY family)
LNLWKKILQENENSKILIKLDSVKNENIDRLKFYMDHLEVNESRIILIDYMDSETHYIDVLKQVDILLDTFPYSGTTTTCKSLFLSIPVLTLYNKDYHSHNVSSSILSHSGLNEFICENETEYMEKAKELYLNRDKLNHYKGGYIHDKFMECMDENKFIQNFENGILQIYMDALQNRKV